MSQPKLTLERLKDLLVYDPDTGVFTRRIAHGRHGCMRAGEVVGSLDNKGYSVIRIDGAIYKAHRLAWLYVTGEWPTGDVDHINRLKADNRFTNLRDVPPTMNRLNMVRPRRDNKLGVLGVYQRGQRFVAHIQVDREVRYLGTYGTIDEARAVYERAKEHIRPGAVLVRTAEPGVQVR